MSVETWEAEFYPESAEDAARGGELKAVDHSIQKWTGLKPENLIRHGLTTRYKMLRDHISGNEFFVSGGTCALCCMVDAPNKGCGSCPLKEVRGVSCDDVRPNESYSPFEIWTYKHSPEPMLMWLEKAREFVLEKEKAA